MKHQEFFCETFFPRNVCIKKTGMMEISMDMFTQKWETFVRSYP